MGCCVTIVNGCIQIDGNGCVVGDCSSGYFIPYECLTGQLSLTVGITSALYHINRAIFDGVWKLAGACFHGIPQPTSMTPTTIVDSMVGITSKVTCAECVNQQPCGGIDPCEQLLVLQASYSQDGSLAISGGICTATDGTVHASASGDFIIGCDDAPCARNGFGTEFFHEALPASFDGSEYVAAGTNGHYYRGGVKGAAVCPSPDDEGTTHSIWRQDVDAAEYPKETVTVVNPAWPNGGMPLPADIIVSGLIGELMVTGGGTPGPPTYPIWDGTLIFRPASSSTYNYYYDTDGVAIQLHDGTYLDGVNPSAAIELVGTNKACGIYRCHVYVGGGDYLRDGGNDWAGHWYFSENGRMLRFPYSVIVGYA